MALSISCFAPLARGASSPDETLARCKSGRHPIRSPAQIFESRGLKIENACPAQSQVDKAHECQDAATLMKNMYELLVEQRKKTCQKAGEAAEQAKKNCESQVFEFKSYFRDEAYPLLGR